VRFAATLLAALLFCPGAAAAQARRTPIEPGRPDTTNSTTTVEPGVIQLENGVAYSHTSTGSGVERRLSIESSVRVGLADQLEFRLDAEPIVWLRGPDNATGSGDYVLNLVWRFEQPRSGSAWPALGVQPFLKVPAATGPIGSGKVDVGTLLLASLDLPADLSLDVNAGLAALGQRRPSGWLLQAIVSSTLTWAPDERWVPFVGIAYFSRDQRGSGDRLSVQAGVFWRLTHDFAVDASVETGLMGQTPEYLPRIGCSIRFGR